MNIVIRKKEKVEKITKNKSINATKRMVSD
jgi:hypothetical protein